mmetsp:Transcript_30227/g.54336  ORF Transcript_30227/g.54336 Transcript_30227/m.54336 type:complete len:81 (-) Transcript_30227:26-268(-)
MFTDACLFNHSCQPNCSWSLSPTSGKMEVWTVLPVRRGQELTISYLGDDVQADRTQRQALIRQNWNFDCRCRKCQREGDS